VRGCADVAACSVHRIAAMTRHADPQTRSRRYRLVVGIDLTEYSEIVLDHALDQAARHHAPELHFLFVREKRHRKRAVDELRHRLSMIVWPSLQTFNRHASAWRARLHVRSGRVDEQIAALAQDVLADLIVIGQFGLHNPSDTLKTLPSRVLCAAPCPTLVVGMPHAMQQSPICNACAQVREDSDGENWFCAAHRAPTRGDTVVSPMTIWSGGTLM
jgi:nucleotide-binding universal stress UspA family protein